MPTRLNPYLMLPGTGRQALEFYADVFGGTPEIMTFGDADPQAAEHGADPAAVMHGFMETPAGALMVSDTPPGGEHRAGNDHAVSLSGDDADTLRGWWERLSDGGQVEVPLSRQMWGDDFGMCTDQYGVKWMVNITSAAAP